MFLTVSRQSSHCPLEAQVMGSGSIDAEKQLRVGPARDLN